MKRFDDFFSSKIETCFAGFNRSFPYYGLQKFNINFVFFFIRFTHWIKIWPSKCITIPIELLHAGKRIQDVLFIFEIIWPCHFLVASKWRGWPNNWQHSAQHWANTHPSDTERKFFCIIIFIHHGERPYTRLEYCWFYK